MKNNNANPTQNINVNDIVASLEPLTKEFFCGEITAEENRLVFKAESGQTFLITVTQI